MIHKQSIVGAEVHSEADLPSTSHQNPNPFFQQAPSGQEGGVLRWRQVIALSFTTLQVWGCDTVFSVI